MSDSNAFSRRQVLGGGVGAAAMLMAGSRLAAAEEKDDLRCGIIGVGGRGGGVLEAINRAPGVRVTAICDTHEGRLNKAAAAVEADKPTLFDDYRKLLDFKELDAVFVETPCYLHGQMVLDVLDSGRHCYAEKPMALKVADCNAIVEKNKSSKKIYQVGTQLRYCAPWQPAIKAILNGEIGRPIMIRAHRHNIGDYPKRSPWFFSRKLSGDTICEQAVHEFDMFCWIFGGPPQRASGFGGRGLYTEPEGRDTMDHYVLSCDFGKEPGDNMHLSYNHSWISSPKTYCDGRQEVVYGTTGAIDIENGKIFPKEGEVRDVPSEPTMSGVGDKATQLAVNDFFRCIRENDHPLADAEAARNGAFTALLGLKAIDEGRVVTLKELLEGPEPIEQPAPAWLRG